MTTPRLIPRTREPIFGLFEDAPPITEQEHVRALFAEPGFYDQLLDCDACMANACATLRDGRDFERCEEHAPVVRVVDGRQLQLGGVL